MDPLFPIAFLDDPKILDASVTPIPGSGFSPIQVVANLGFKAAYALDYIDSTGDFIGVYQGDPGIETLRCIIGGGITSRSNVVITAQSRVSFRSMTATPITSGKLSCTFMGC